MPAKHLHIVSFAIPYPADYGGAIDVFFKLKALHELGVKIHLHCFEYDRKRTKRLNKYCEKVDYYKRRVNKSLLFHQLPYIVISRYSEQLMQNLLKDDHPILFEGLHCCFHLDDPRIKKRLKLVRMHNIEHEYYRNLSKVESKLYKKYYFSNEAKKLEKFESILKHANKILSISNADAAELKKRYKNISAISAFHPHETVSSKQGKGKFALYHGSLGVPENHKAAKYLAEKVFNDIDVPFIIAGNAVSNEIKEAVKHKKNISIQSDVSTESIYGLIRDAQVNILPTFQATGIKLKLLAALFSGRHCLVNIRMVQQTGLEELCAIANTASKMKKELLRLMNETFSEEDQVLREKILLPFTNKENARKLLELID